MCRYSLHYLNVTRMCPNIGLLCFLREESGAQLSCECTCLECTDSTHVIFHKSHPKPVQNSRTSYSLVSFLAPLLGEYRTEDEKPVFLADLIILKWSKLRPSSVIIRSARANIKIGRPSYSCYNTNE